MKASTVNNLSGKIGGATLTKSGRGSVLQKVQTALKSAGRANFKLETMKSKDVQMYMKSRLDDGISKRTLQNEATYLRSAFKAIGRSELADSDRMSCKSLGIDGANRDGTHKALPAESYDKALENVERDGSRACLQLQRELGLRQREAVQSVDSLKTWLKALERGDMVRVVHGTKGGRVRDTSPINRQNAIKAVKTALEASKNGKDWLIPSKSLEGAVKMYERDCGKVGLRGDFATHSLRYAYAQDKMAQNLEYTEGDRAEALALTSLELGHGGTRGVYVEQVYLK